MSSQYKGGAIIMGGDWWDLLPVGQTLRYDCAKGKLTIRDSLPDPAAGMAGSIYPRTWPTPSLEPPSDVMFGH